ncbi:MAG: bifunctional precorrin-2 dehydrogenase/sirohydrochlorin ferrochelatase [Magnetococcales bacterium]|nr:bifunctional precorrin-2 dehydrogenase/sirohydrochlorin ferrochelatase [Magnetococcales bacterium]
MVGYLTEMVLEGRPVLCIGGGQVALRKLTGLLPSGPHITVVAPELHPTLAAWVREGKVHHRPVPFTPEVLDEPPPPLLLFAATGQAQINQEIARQARQRGLLCNSADHPGSSGFLVPAVVRRGPVLVGVGTGGCSPALARLLKERLEGWLEPGWGELAVQFAALRERVKRHFPDPARRYAFWRQTALAVAQERRFEQEENGPWLEARLRQSMPGDGQEHSLSREERDAEKI